MPDDSTLFGIRARQPPSNIQAEQALLGAILANNRAFERVADFLKPEHFIDPIHQRLYQRITERILDGYLADAVTLKDDFENTGILEEVGGTAYLAQLLSAMVGIINAGEYGRAIHDTWLRRQLVEVGETIVNNAFGADEALDGPKQIEAAERALADLAGAGVRRDRVLTLGAAVSAALKQSVAIYRGGASPAVLTGMATVDKAFGGLWPKDLTLLAGIPGAGKTALATQMGFRVAKRIYDAATARGLTPEQASKLPGVVFFSLEMSAEQLGARIAAERAGVSVEKLMAGDLDMELAVRLADAERECALLPMRIHDCRATSVRLLGAKARLHLQRQPEVLAIVDHLLVMENDSPKSRNSGNDPANVAKAARDLKQLAGDLGLPIMVLTHATRASASRPNPRPTQSDVKWAGEGDADVLVFVHRPVMFMDAEPPPQRPRESKEAYAERRLDHYRDYDQKQQLAELVVAKRRMGAAGVHRLRWDGPTTSFREWSTIDPEDEAL